MSYIVILNEFHSHLPFYISYALNKAGILTVWWKSMPFSFCDGLFRLITSIIAWHWFSSYNFWKYFWKIFFSGLMFLHAFSIFAADIFSVIISYSTDQSLKNIASTKKVPPTKQPTNISKFKLFILNPVIITFIVPTKVKQSKTYIKFNMHAWLFLVLEKVVYSRVLRCMFVSVLSAFLGKDGLCQCR